MTTSQPVLLPHPHILTPLQSHLLSFLLSSIYVGSLYLSKKTRTYQGGESARARGIQNERDDPRVIQARLRAVTVATILCIGVVSVLTYSHLRPVQMLQFLGLIPNFDVPISKSILPHLISPALFLGPLYTTYLYGMLPLQKRWRDTLWANIVPTYGFIPPPVPSTTGGNDKGQFQFPYGRGKWGSWTGLRNYWVGPITEEIVFRSCVLSVYRLSGTGMWKMILVGPLGFGLAHAHHAWDTYNRFGRTKEALRMALFGAVFQLIYTTLFGIHSSYIFLKTSSIYPVITGHIFCNIMGLPGLKDDLRVWKEKRGVIWIMYLGGILAYGYVIGRWSQV